MNIRMIAAVAGTAVTLFVTALPTYAAYREQPVDITISVTVEEDGSGEFSRIVAESLDGPEEDRVLSIREGKTAELTFTMEEPGCRTYRIYQQPGDRKDMKYDRSEYTAVIFAWSEEDGLYGTAVLKKDTETQKPAEVVFCNQKIERQVMLVRTGDDTSAVLWSGIGLAAAAAGGVFLKLMKRGKER